MLKFRFVLAVALTLISFASLGAAEPLKAYLSDFHVSGAPDPDGLKVSLSRMLASRLNPAKVQLIQHQNQAQLVIDGSFTQFGKGFSLDVLLTKTGSGDVSKVFEQGEGQDDFFPALSRLVVKIERELAVLPLPVVTPAATLVPAAQAATPAASSASSATVPAPVLPAAKPVGEAAISGKEAYVVRSANVAENANGAPELPLDGVFKGIALGRKIPSGEREIFLVGDHQVRWYLQGAGLKLIAEASVPVPGTIIAIDTADLDHDGVPELFVSVLDRGNFSSQVFRARDGKLVKLAENLPWGFRGVGPDLKSRVIYTQKMRSNGELFDLVAVLNQTGDHFSEKDPGKLPGFCTVYNFARLQGGSAEGSYLVLDSDGHPVVSSGGKELWKGEQILGGSETVLGKPEEFSARADNNYHWNFMEQRMLTLPDGTLLVPRNEGTFSLGNSRAYSRHVMYAFEWTGARLVEKWHSPQMQSYLADFAFDAGSKELILLEVTKKSSIFSKGSTLITTRTID